MRYIVLFDYRFEAIVGAFALAVEPDTAIVIVAESVAIIATTINNSTSVNPLRVIFMIFSSF